jgi:hypothetical protein
MEELGGFLDTVKLFSDWLPKNSGEKKHRVDERGVMFNLFS